jgi:oxygen-independent coproporphyrinogen-3 oxidase
MKPIGLYLHIPFCNGKCPYCDFYSITPSGNIIDKYTDALCREIEKTDFIFDYPEKIREKYAIPTAFQFFYKKM